MGLHMTITGAAPLIRLPEMPLTPNSRPAEGAMHQPAPRVVVYVPQLRSSAYALAPFVRRSPEFGHLGVHLVFVTASDRKAVEEFRQEHGLPVSIISDEGGNMTRSLNLQAACRPVVLVVDRDGYIRESITFPDAHIDGIIDRIRRLSES